MGDYANPDVLVSTDWVKENLGTPGIKLVEIDVDTKAYDAGHVPGSIGWNWQTGLQDQVRRTILGQEQFETLMSDSGISPDDTLILYGDNHNWFAAYGFWLCKIYGHEDVRLMNGGRQKWLDDDDKELSTDPPSITPTQYKVSNPDPNLRTLLPDVLEASKSRDGNLVDVRSPDEFSGKIIAPPGLPETAQRAGHIPGATNVPWMSAVAEDGTFKPVDELRRIYIEDAGVDPSKKTIAYCRIGERSSHTWFVLANLLGLDNVTNYDGSWTEYGNLVDVPIEKDVQTAVLAGG